MLKLPSLNPGELVTIIDTQSRFSELPNPVLSTIYTTTSVSAFIIDRIGGAAYVAIYYAESINALLTSTR